MKASESNPNYPSKVREMTNYTIREIKKVCKDIGPRPSGEENERKAQDYDKNSSTMNETKKKETEESLQQMYQKIQQTAQDNQQALGKLQQEKIGPITNKLVDAIKAVGKAGGYVYIMDVTSGIPYISDTLSKDVTAEVKAELNKTAPAKK